jgi:AI-2 transport protein TqsA
MKERSTTNTLLMIMVIPLVFYLLKILSFIFVPLFFSMFISLLFLPLMRWLQKKKVPKTLSLSSIIAIIFLIFYLSGKLLSKEFCNSLTTKMDGISDDNKLTDLLKSLARSSSLD